LFSWLKKNKPIEPMAQSDRGATPALEILLPEELMKSGVPELRMASKFLALLAESQLPLQHLEIFDGMPLVNSPYQPIKQFLTTVNGAKQLKTFLAQVELMLFKARSPNAKGSLCCIVNGSYTEFELAVRAQNATINWQITRHVSPAT
jgi:hypothetical protein